MERSASGSTTRRSCWQPRPARGIVRVLLPILLLPVLAGIAVANGNRAATYLSWHNRCLSGDADVIDAQIARFEAQLAADKNDHLARVYLGSACALRAKASFWGPTKLRYLKRGRVLMEAAVDGAPRDPRVRMVRAIGYYKVPERFGTRPTAVKDFEFLVPIAKDPRGGLATGERQVILYYAAKCFEEVGKAGATRMRALCHEIDPDSEYGKLTR